jgi:clan AA aspartic protease (TIGR02281 family)
LGSTSTREAPLSGDDSQLLVEARLNGQVSGLFLVDTGASYCVITPELAEQLGVAGRAGADPIALLTPAGKIEAHMTSLRSVEVARARAGHVPTVIYPAVEAPLSGILGLSFLRQFEFSVDTRRRVLRLRPF